ncbi:MAG: hypothetical protein IKO32_03655 [Lachnospiraceae bacterium]|nr:hypothetical protein [Lachnospiraceae bacterium]
MKNTPIGYEISDFLTGLESLGEPDKKYNAFVRKYTRFRKKEIKQADKEAYEVYRQRRIDAFSGFILVIGFFAFFGVILYLLLYPVIKNGGVSLDVIIKHMNASHADILSAAAVMLFCFSTHFKQVHFRLMTNILSILWCAVVIFTRIYGMGPYMDINSPAWVIFGRLLLTFTLINVFSTRFGIYMYQRVTNRDELIRDSEHVFTPIETVYLIFMILSNGICLYFLIDTNRFYALTDRFPVSRFVLSAFPVLIFILYCIWHANRMDGDSVDAWFCTSMEVFTTALILQIFAVPNLLHGLMLWIGLILVSIVVLIYLGNIIGSPMAYLAIGMISLNFIVSGSINYYSEEAGTEILGVATHWWMVVPALLTAGMAIFVTIREMIREKL